MQSAEIELKFPVDQPGLLEARLPELGFRLLTPRTFETNTLFDTPNRTFGTGNFGRIFSAEPARQMQFGMKLIF